MEAYEEIRQLMRGQGYSLRTETLLHEAHPDPIGIVVECIGMAIAAAISVFYFFIALFLDDRVGPVAVEASWAVTGVIVVTGVGALLGIARLVVHYLDMRRRRYRVYDDTIVYEEGFLTRDNAFLPAENIADASTNRTLLDRILGLYDVLVSCQGAGQDIKFRRLRTGAELAAAVDRVVDTFDGRPRPSASKALASSEAPAGGMSTTDPAAPSRIARPARSKPEEAFTATLRVDGTRALLGALIWDAAFPDCDRQDGRGHPADHRDAIRDSPDLREDGLLALEHTGTRVFVREGHRRRAEGEPLGPGPRDGEPAALVDRLQHPL